MSEEYSLEQMIELEKVVTESLERKYEQQDPVRNKRKILIENAVKIYKKLTVDIVNGMEDRQIHKWYNRYFRLRNCGKFSYRMNPLTGTIQTIPMLCRDYKHCENCRKLKAENESTKLEVRTNTSDNGATTIVLLENEQAYKALQAKLYRDKEKGDDNDVLRRYAFEDGTIEVWLDKPTDYDNGVIKSEEVKGYIPTEMIEERLERLLPGSRLSGSVKSEQIGVKKEEVAPKEKELETPKETREDRELKLRAELELKLADENGELSQTAQDSIALELMMTKDPDDKQKVYTKDLVVELNCDGTTQAEIHNEALGAMYKETYLLNPDLETLQFAINERQDSYMRHLKDITDRRGINIIYCQYITNTFTATRSKIDWKGAFKQFVLRQYDFDPQILAEIPEK